MILTNGCSFTEGYYLDDLQFAWPFQFGNILNQPVVNLAQGGSSNQRIFRTTIDYLSTNNPKYLVIGWTSVSRYELPIYNGTYARLTTSGLLFHEPITSNPDAELIYKFYYKNLFNDYLNTLDLLNYIITLQTICLAKNIKYIFFNAFIIPNFKSILKNYHEYYKHDEFQLDDKLIIAENIINQKIAQIDQSSFWEWNTNTMSDWCKNHNFPFEPQGHPKNEGHLAFAKLLAEKIT